MWVPIVAGAACFPVLPLAWDLFGQWRRRKRGGRPILTFFDRLVLRTLVLNLVFVGGLVGFNPDTVFSALSRHGDWMLDGRDEPWAAQARERLHLAADNLAWLHELTHPNVYEELIDPETTGDDGVDPRPGSWSDYDWQPTQDPTRPEDVFGEKAWPFEPTLHPLVRSIPEDAQSTPQAIGAYFLAHESNPTQRLKAVHDYVADRIAYDVPALRSRNFPSQDAQTVLDSGLAVCAGYAQLVKAIGDAAELKVVVVVGQTRSGSDAGHAWNAAEIDGRWYLLDATWDAGPVDGDRFIKKFGTDYFMTPPDVFLNDHFPDQPKWQLREEPVSLGDFMRRPNLEPSFSAYGFSLVSPTRSSVTVHERTATIRIENPNHFQVSAASYRGETWDGPRQRCGVSDAGDAFVCPLVDGPNLLVMFGPDRSNMGQVLVTAK